MTLSIPVFAMATEDVGRIVSYEINDTEAFAFIPDGIEARRGAGRGNTTAVQQIAPIIIVYGDEPFTAESAMQTAVDSGLANIARAEGAVISFVNPKTDGVWSADDVATYRSIVQTKYIERPQNQIVPVNGVYPSATVPGGQFAGYFFRTYIIAAGSGADFAVSFLMDDTMVENRNIQAMPASYMLFDVSAVPGPNAGLMNQEHPALIVNGSPESISAIRELNSRSNFFAVAESSTGAFDKTVLTNGYRDLTGTMVRPQLAWAPLPNWSIALFQLANYLQIEEQSHAFGYTSKAVTGGTAFYDYFIPKSIDINAPESAPLVMVFHGSGESSSYIANIGGWTKLGIEEGFMTVSVDNHGTPAVLNALLDELLAEFPFIDPARIYATGYSMGAMKTWSLIGATDRAERFAGVAPWNGLTVAAGDQRTTIVPTIYLTGRDDTTTRLPGVGTAAQTNGPRNAMGFLFERQQIGTYAFNAEDNPWWGVSGHTVEVFPAKSWNGEINIHTYESRLGNGMVYTKLVDGTNFGHSIVGDFAPLAWDFLRQFSRNADGTISVQPISVTPSAFVTRLNGNQNDLTITVTVEYKDGPPVVFTETFRIRNNAEGTYEVGPYSVFVDTKGNDQIRACRIVN
jgi:poly(3-hydroxybutyrate) depolymerase